MIDPWTHLLTFLAVAVGLFGVYSMLCDLWMRDMKRVCRRVDSEFLQRQRERAQATPLYKNLDRLAEELAADEPRSGWRKRVELLVEQAGLDVQVRAVCYAAAFGAVGLAVGAVLLVRGAWAIPPGALLGASMPFVYLTWKRRRRLSLLASQLPDALENMGRALRAGHTMSQALQVIVRDFDQPLAGEFAFCYERQNLGVPPQTSYQDLARRVDLFELRIFALCMTVQQETGGNIAEILDKLAAGGRERIRGQLRTRSLTAESRLQANVLLALPAVIFLCLWVLKRGYAEMLLTQPTLLAGTLAAQLLGAWWVRRIVNAEE